VELLIADQQEILGHGPVSGPDLIKRSHLGCAEHWGADEIGERAIKRTEVSLEDEGSLHRFVVARDEHVSRVTSEKDDLLIAIRTFVLGQRRVVERLAQATTVVVEIRADRARRARQ